MSLWSVSDTELQSLAARRARKTILFCADGTCAMRPAGGAPPSEVLVSSTVKDLVAGSSLRFVDRGVHNLHGVPGEWRLFAVEG